MRTCGQPLRPPLRRCFGIRCGPSIPALLRSAVAPVDHRPGSATIPVDHRPRSATIPFDHRPSRRQPWSATAPSGHDHGRCNRLGMSNLWGADRTRLATVARRVSLPGAGVLLRHVGAFDGRFAATEAPGRLPAGVSQEELRLLPQVNGAVHQQPKGTRPEGGVVRVQTARKLTRHQAKPSRRGNSAELPTDATPGRNWGCRRSTSVSPQMPDRGRR